MIRRIKQIKGVGTFVGLEGGAHQFEQLTFIFGENGYGKSTICDILSSLAQNNPEFISGRESIHPLCTGGQCVKLNVDTLEKKGNDIVFKDRAWNKTIPGGLSLLIFDTGFIHRNVFTGLEIERENKKNITDFILGEESIQSAEKVEQLKQESRKIGRQISGYIKGSFKKIADIDNFIKTEVDETKEALSDSLEEIVVKGKEKREVSNNIEKIKKRGVPREISLIEDFLKLLNKGNQLFEQSLENIHDSTEEQITNHILTKMTNESGGKAWLQNGIKFQKEGLCPFCGQPFIDDAKNLIKAYQNQFDENFKKFVAKINTKIFETEVFFENSKISDSLIFFENNFLIVESYKEIESDEFVEIKKKLEQFQELDSSIKNFNNMLNTSAKVYEKKSTLKKNNTLESLPAIDFSDLIDTFSKLETDLKIYNQSINLAISIIETFKKELSSESINTEILQFEDQYRSLNFKKIRLEKDEDCKHYITLKADKINTEKSLKTAYEQLEKTQNEYLENYFDSINYFFQKFGSNDFEITKKINKLGNKPVISLGVKFKGKSITNNKIKCVFGESDRRALALSIFWTKVMRQNDEEKKRSIVVLDDPVTIFDNGRIERTIREMDKSIKSLRQIIVLTHYPSYLKRFYDRENSALETKIIKISKEHDGAKFMQADPNDFVENEHQLNYRKIIEFIERKHSDDILQELRVYFDHELKSRFRYQIECNSINSFMLSHLISGLFENQCISNSIHETLDCLRKSLNTPHHTWSGYSHEEKIGIANDVMNCVYLKLQPATDQL